MKIFNNKNILHKLIVAIVVVVMTVNIFTPTYSHAAFDWAGALFEPIKDFVCGLGDAVINLLQSTFIEGAPTAVSKYTLAEFEGESHTINEFLANFPLSDRVLTTGSSWIANLIGDDTADINGDGTVSGSEINQYYGSDIVLPQIAYGPEYIFANKIPAFDINFINPTVENPEVYIESNLNTTVPDNIEYIESIGSNASEKQRIINIFREKQSEILQKAEVSSARDLYSIILHDGTITTTATYNNIVQSGKATEEELRWAIIVEEGINAADFMNDWDYIKQAITNAEDAGVSLGRLEQNNDTTRKHKSDGE